MSSGEQLGSRLRSGDLAAAPAVLNLVESFAPGDRGEAAALLRAVAPAALGREAPGHVVGVTGPPGVGKSTLLSALIGAWRRGGRTVAALAVDPSSKRSGGALLGDRARIEADPTDAGVFIRSMAAGQRLGGLAPATRAAASALAAAFDVVVIETVGVGQSETEVSELADTVVVVLQPGSGDTLQFLKAGLMETPDLLVVTKADMGAPAAATVRDAGAALRALDAAPVAVLAVSCLPPPHGIAELVAALDAHARSIDVPARRLASRRRGALADFVSEHGERGLRLAGGRRGAARFVSGLPAELDPPGLVAALERHAGLDSLS